MADAGYGDGQTWLGATERKRAARLTLELMQIDAEIGGERQGVAVAHDDVSGLGAQPAECRPQPAAAGVEVGLGPEGVDSRLGGKVPARRREQLQELRPATGGQRDLAAGPCE